MVKRILKLPNVSGSAITSTGATGAHTITCDLPVGPRYHVIWIEGDAGTDKKVTDQIGEIRLKVNGKTQRVMTADELNKINILQGSKYCCIGAGTNGARFYLPIYLAEPWRGSARSAEGLAWATGADSVSTFQVECDIKAYTASGTAETPVFRAEVDDSIVVGPNGTQEVGLGLISKWYNVQIPVASGWNDFMLLPRERGEAYQQISLIDYANLVEFEVKVNNTIIRQDTRDGNTARLTARGMVPVPTSTATPSNLAVDLAPTRGMTDIVFDHDDLLSSALPMVLNGRKVTDFNLRINTTTSGNVKAVYQVIGPAD